jgi:hypothetical protein
MATPSLGLICAFVAQEGQIQPYLVGDSSHSVYDYFINGFCKVENLMLYLEIGKQVINGFIEHFNKPSPL